MTDLTYLLETLLLLAIPLAPVALGVMLRRKFPPPGEEPVPAARKLGRLAGNILLWGGVAGILFMIVVALNFKGKI